MPEMTPEERILCALGREEPDCVPLYDLVSSRALISYWAGQTLTIENADKLIPLALSHCLDMTRVFLPSPLGRRVDEQGFTYERTDWFNEWQIGKPFQNMDGLRTFVQADIERQEAAIPADPRKELAEALEWKRRFRGTVIPASWAGEALQDAYIRVGLDWFVWLDADDPILTRRWIDALHSRLMRRLQSELDVRSISPVAWIFADVAYKNRLIFSPAFLDKSGFFQRLAEINDLYHSRDLKVIFHSDGDICKIIPKLISLGVDAIAPIDTAAGMALPALKAEYGDRLAFVGGVDAELVLRHGTQESIRATVRELIAQAAHGGGLILGASSEELLEDFPLENILTMHTAVREFGRYPINI